MMNKQIVINLISPVYAGPVKTDILTKHINVSRYDYLASEIADDILPIDEVFPEEELDIIYERFAPYLSEYEVFPFLGILGGNVVAIGCGDRNKGKIYYFDFDFGIFELDSTIVEFIGKLEPNE